MSARTHHALAAAMRPKPPTSAFEQLLRIAPVLTGGYMLLGAAAGRSEVRAVLGRYSPGLAGVLGASALLYVVWTIARARGGLRIEQLCLLMLAGASYLLPASNQVRQLAGVGFVLPALRLSAGLAVCLIELRIARMRDHRVGIALWVAAALALLASADIALLLAPGAERARPPEEAGFRVPYDLQTLADDGVALIGGSPVWGRGVAGAQRFGDQLELLYAHANAPRRVYSLGINDADLAVDLRTLSRLPERRRNTRLVLAFSVDDMPPRPRAVDRIRDQLVALAIGAPSLRLLADAADRALAPDPARREQLIIARYAPNDASYAQRFAQLETAVARFRALAATRSMQAPALLIIPLMADFEHYPLSAAHDRVRQVGERYGFKVVDLLPAFRAQLNARMDARMDDGQAHRAGPGDPQLGAAAHALIARTLRDAL